MMAIFESFDQIPLSFSAGDGVSEIFLLLSFLLFDLSGIDHENKNWTMICLSAVVFSILLPFIESLVSILDFCAVQGRHAMDVK